MSIILDEEQILHLFSKIQSYKDNNKITKFKYLLHLIEDSIEKYHCPGSNSFLSCIYTNTRKDFIAYLKDNHQVVLEKIKTLKIIDNTTIHFQALQKTQDKTSCWVLKSIVEKYPFSSTVNIIDTVLELANETLFSPISENQWVKDIKIYLSHFLANINPYNLEELFEL